MRAAWMMVCLLLLPGCLDEEPLEAQDVEPTQAAPVPEPLRYEGSFSLFINPELPSMAVGGYSRNCVFFWDTDGAAYTLGAGNVTLTWDALPNAERLQLRTTGTVERVVVAAGTSPVTHAFDQIELDAGWGVGFWAEHNTLEGSVPVAQSATLDVSFEYTGDLPEPSVGVCGGGDL